MPERIDPRLDVLAPRRSAITDRTRLWGQDRFRPGDAPGASLAAELFLDLP